MPMPAFGAKFSDDEIASLSNVLTSRLGAYSSSLTAPDVAKLRQPGRTD